MRTGIPRGCDIYNTFADIDNCWACGWTQAVLIEGGEEATNLQDLCGLFYLLLVVPLFVHTWQLNDTNPLGHELPPKSLVKILEGMAEAASLRARLPTDSEQVLDRKHQEALRENLQTKSRWDQAPANSSIMVCFTIRFQAPSCSPFHIP